MITCPYCGELTQIKGVILLDRDRCSGRSKCDNCGKEFLYRYESEGQSIKIGEEFTDEYQG